MKQERTVKSWMIQLFSMAAIMLLFIFLGQKSLTVFADKSLENNPPIPIQTPTIMVPGTGWIVFMKVIKNGPIFNSSASKYGTAFETFGIFNASK